MRLSLRRKRMHQKNARPLSVKPDLPIANRRSVSKPLKQKGEECSLLDRCKLFVVGAVLGPV